MSTIAIATLLLTGCSAAKTSAEPASIAPTDMCAAAAAAGPVSDSLSVPGAVGSPASLVLTEPLTISTVERTVLVEGEGEPIDGRSLVRYARTIFDAATGEQRSSEGYDGAALLPLPAATAAAYLGCATVGSRLVITMPEDELQAAAVWVLDVLDAVPGVATGADEQPTPGMPTVTEDEHGAPVVAVPGGEPSPDTQVARLKTGTGRPVTAADTVTMHYTGIRWSNGEPFDSTWLRGAPTAMAVADSVAGFRAALDGQPVGSRVLAVIPPASAYGEGEITDADLTGETLVFVIDILDAVALG